MPLFEVFIPTTDPNGFDITARVRADSWIVALRSGLAKLGDTGDIRNVMVDITEQGIDVTEPHSGRVFRIRELEDAGAPHAAASAAAAPVPVAVAPVAPPAPVAAAPVAPPTPRVTPPVAPAAAVPRPAATPPRPPMAGTPPIAHAAPPPATRGLPPAAPRPAGTPPAAPGAPRAVARPPTTAAAAAAAAERPVVQAGPRFAAPAAHVEEVTQQKAAGMNKPMGRVGEKIDHSAEDLIGELFEITQTIYEQPTVAAAAGFILDLAMRSIVADSGAVFISDINASDLFFAAARGPKAKEAMKFRVPMGQGIVGFCAEEGVALAVSDVHRDPRFYATVSKNIGYETKSILCCPAQIEGRVFGAIELINKGQATSFSSNDVHIVNFLAHEFAEYLVNTGQTGE